MRLAITFVTLASAAVTFAQTTALPGTQVSSDSAYQFRYFSNLEIGDSFINISNSGASGADPTAAGTSANVTGAICANVYVFDPAEELVSCCSCPVTPNGLVSLSAQRDLISNPLTAGTPTSIVVKLLATVPVGGTCRNSAAGVAATSSGRNATPTVTLASGMGAWGTTLHANTSAAAGTYAMTEAEFKPQPLSTGELNRLGTLCSFAAANGSGFGICNSCRLGGL